MLLKDRTAIVTGAAQGIGKAIVEEMTAQGAKVVVMDINEQTLKNTCEKLNQKHGEVAYPFVGDVSSVDSLHKLCDYTISTLGSIDILVNNAGIAINTPIEELGEQEWDKVLDINLKSVFFLSQRVFTEMKKQKFGRIINMASLAGERGGRYAGAHYSASKAAVLVLAKTFALSGGEYNITANAIAPGLIDTEMSRKLGHTTEEIPMKKLGLPSDVAKAAVYLASDMGDYISGMTIDVNGGQFMR